MVGQSRSFIVTGVIGIFILSFWVGMSPHWEYRYPLHVDEWFNIGIAQETLDTGSLQFSNPYWGGGISYHAEMGFQMILVYLKSTTGLSWLGLYELAPGVLLTLLAFLTYAVGHRRGFGWAAALFVVLIPTSIRTLGPAFVVPVSVAMLFIPVTLLTLQNFEESSRGSRLWVVLLVLGGTLFVHPPTLLVVAALAAMYLGSYVLLTVAKRQYRAAIGLVFAAGVRMAIPFLILAVWLPTQSAGAIKEVLGTGSGQLLGILGVQVGFASAFGVGAVGVSIAGVFVYLVRYEYGVQSVILPLFTVLLLAYLLFVFPEYTWGPHIFYERGWSYLGLLLAIFAGYATNFYFSNISTVAAWLTSRMQGLRRSWIMVPLVVSGIFALLLVFTTGLVTNDYREQYSNFYHIVGEVGASDYTWMGKYSPTGRKVAFAEPTASWAYLPMAGTGAITYEAIAAPFRSLQTDKLREMANSGKADIRWLQEQNISMFYAEGHEFTNPELLEVREGIYYLQISAR